ncbi:hypothetical protein GE09DRAFT_1060334 [Coniochaeta sp. 2T2.1]|nr:hypothetical protein GE09DRAFT_1060334 [Coniochaeta sp. 2T2.1]
MPSRLWTDEQITFVLHHARTRRNQAVVDLFVAHFPGTPITAAQVKNIRDRYLGDPRAAQLAANAPPAALNHAAVAAQPGSSHPHAGFYPLGSSMSSRIVRAAAEGYLMFTAEEDYQLNGNRIGEDYQPAVDGQHDRPPLDDSDESVGPEEYDDQYPDEGYNLQDDEVADDRDEEQYPDPSDDELVEQSESDPQYPDDGFYDEDGYAPFEADDDSGNEQIDCHEPDTQYPEDGYYNDAGNDLYEADENYNSQVPVDDLDVALPSIGPDQDQFYRGTNAILGWSHQA